jgi:hypothetical protein
VYAYHGIGPTRQDKPILTDKIESKFYEAIFEDGWDGLTESSSLPLSPKRVAKEVGPCVGVWNQDLIPKSLKRTSDGEMKPPSPVRRNGAAAYFSGALHDERV